MEHSSAQILAIDTGRPFRTRAASASAEALDRAATERRRLEQRRFGWLPGRRHALEAARQHEIDARRALVEAQHGARPFDTEQDFLQHVDRVTARQAERATERVLRQERGMGREL